MGRRTTGRKLAMQVIYQAEVNEDKLNEAISDYIEASKFHNFSKSFSIELARGAWTSREEADTLLTNYAIGWDLDRISLIDKSICRLAFYELIHTDTPHTVVLNEAIELAKKYAAEDSPKFINGILGAYVKDNVHGSN